MEQAYEKKPTLNAEAVAQMRSGGLLTALPPGGCHLSLCTYLCVKLSSRDFILLLLTLQRRLRDLKQNLNLQ